MEKREEAGALGMCIRHGGVNEERLKGEVYWKSINRRAPVIESLNFSKSASRSIRIVLWQIYKRLFHKFQTLNVNYYFYSLAVPTVAHSIQSFSQ